MSIIIAFTGKQDSGKSTAARYLRERYGFGGSNLTDPMDEMLAPLLRRMRVHEAEIASRLSGGMKNVPIRGFEWLTGRKLKQALGLEFRDAVSAKDADGVNTHGIFHDLWVSENLHLPRLVHDQVRYPFEAALIRRDGGRVYQVVDPDGVIQDGHESERIDFPVDAVIENPKHGVHLLHARLDALMAGEGIAPLEAN